jgi:hypothetical protein
MLVSLEVRELLLLEQYSSSLYHNGILVDLIIAIDLLLEVWLFPHLLMFL